MCYHVIQKTATALLRVIPGVPLLFFVCLKIAGLPARKDVYYETDRKIWKSCF